MMKKLTRKEAKKRFNNNLSRKKVNKNCQLQEVWVWPSVVDDKKWPPESGERINNHMYGNNYWIDKINQSNNSKGVSSGGKNILILMFPKDDPQNKLELPREALKSAPLILLDIDGVINCLERKGQDIWNKYYSNIIKSRVETLDITWSPEVVKRINKWADIAEIRWLTSWGWRAVTSISPGLGFKKFKVAKFDKFDTAKGLTICDLKRPIVWIDDDLHGLHGWDSIEYCLKEFEKVHKGKRLLIDPAEHLKEEGIIGLKPEDLDKVDEFLKKFI